MQRARLARSSELRPLGNSLTRVTAQFDYTVWAKAVGVIVG